MQRASVQDACGAGATPAAAPVYGLTCTGAVLDRSWLEVRPCLRWMAPHMICCMPLVTTEMAAMIMPRKLTDTSVTVLRVKHVPMSPTTRCRADNQLRPNVAHSQRGLAHAMCSRASLVRHLGMTNEVR